MTTTETYTMTLKVTMDSEPKLGVLKVKANQLLADNAIVNNIIQATLTQTTFTLTED